MFTFVVEFDCPDVTLLSDVIVEVATDAGTVWEMSAVWDDEAGGFVASGDITDGLPTNVSARYVYDGEIVFSPEHMMKIRAAEQAWMEQGGDVDYTGALNIAERIPRRSPMTLAKSISGR